MRSYGWRDLTWGLAGVRPESAAWGGLSGSFDGVDNLVALVTGANKGIGKEIARQLADAGLTVYVGSRDAARGERAAEEIGGDTRLLVLDVTDDASIAAAARGNRRHLQPHGGAVTDLARHGFAREAWLTIAIASADS